MAYGRATVPEIAAACGCSEKTVLNKCFKLRLPLTPRINEAVRSRIAHNAKAGRRPSWIARQINIPIEVVEIHAAPLTPADA